MSKILWGSAAVAAVVGVGFGGYFVLEHQVRGTIEDTFDTINTKTPFIKSASYGEIQVDLLKDTAAITNTTFEVDPKKILEATPYAADKFQVSGTISQSQERIDVFGIWDLILGKTLIAKLDITNATFKGDTQQVQQLPADAKTGETRTVTISASYAGTATTATVTGLDISSIGQAATMTPLGASIAHYSAENVAMDMDISADVPETAASTLRSSNPANRALDAVHSEIHIDTMTGDNITPDHIGQIEYTGLTISNSLPKSQKSQQDPFNMRIKSVSARDITLRDMQPVKMTFAMQDLVVDPDVITDPKARAFMTMLGMDGINISMTLGYDFNQDDKTFSLSPLRLGLKQAGTVDLGFDLDGLPDIAVFEKFQELAEAQQQNDETQMAILNRELENAFQGLALDALSVGYADDGILKKFLAMQAMQMKATPDKMAKMYALKAAMILDQIFGREQSEDVRLKLQAFLTEPDALRINLKAKAPIPFKRLAKDIKANGPMALKVFQLEVNSGANAQMVQ